MRRMGLSLFLVHLREKVDLLDINLVKYLASDFFAACVQIMYIQLAEHLRIVSTYFFDMFNVIIVLQTSSGRKACSFKYTLDVYVAPNDSCYYEAYLL